MRKFSLVLSLILLITMVDVYKRQVQYRIHNGFAA